MYYYYLYRDLPFYTGVGLWGGVPYFCSAHPRASIGTCNSTQISDCGVECHISVVPTPEPL